MATSQDLGNCITAHGVKTHARLPEAVKSAVAAGRADLAIAAMKEHIASLKAIQASVKGEHKTAVKEFMDAVVSQSSASSYVNRGAADPTNELNNFKVKTFSKIWKNLVQRFGSVTKALESKSFAANEIDAGDINVLKHFASKEGLNRKLGLAIEEIFKAKVKDPDPKKPSAFPFRYEDMIQYLPLREKAAYTNSDLALDPITKETGKLDAATRAAMAATAYEWIATDGRKSMGQTDATIAKFLDLKKGEHPPANAVELLYEMGTGAENTARQLGRVIVQRMGIEAGPEADAMAQERLELSMGYMTLAAMEHVGIIERQHVIMDRTLDANAALTIEEKANGAIGVEALKKGKRLKRSDIFYTETGDPKGMAGKLTLTTVTLVNEELLTEIEETFKHGRNAFDKLFANETQELGVAWKPFKKRSLTIGRSKVKANSKQQANIDKYSNTPYVRNGEAIDFLKAAYGLIDPNIPEGEPNPIKDLFYELLGSPNTDNLLEIHNKNSDGVRRGLEREFRAVLAFEDDHARQVAKGEGTEFYLPSVFMATMRMLMRGDINPQNSKMHRSLFAPTGFTVTFAKGTETEIDTAFHEAIAVAFDIETGKNLIGDHKAQIAKLKDKIKNSPEIRQAIKAIQEYNKTKVMTLELLTDINAGVAKIDNKVTGLKGLFEYARYASLKKGESFTTDIHAEIDGVSNGPIIATLQLIPDSADKRAVLATLAMGGISTKKKKESLNKLLIQHNLNDAYQRMGNQWAIEVAQLKEKLQLSGKAEDARLLKQAKALGAILGPFQGKDGVISKTVRSLSKPRTMQIVFGSGMPNQIELFSGTNVIHEGIYKQIEDIIGKVRKEEHASAELELETLLANVRELTRGAGSVASFKTGDKLDIDKLKKFEFDATQIADITKAVKNTYGKAMEQAVNIVYAPIMEARVPFNNAVQVGVTVYNTILRKKIELKVAGKTGLQAGTLTKAELQEIVESIAHLIPRIKTPYHTDADPSYLPLGHVGNNKSYTKQAKVSQSYKTGTVSAHEGYAEGFPFLKESGVAPMITGIHMTDSMVANGLMALDTHILNNHDGFSHSIKDSRLISDQANQIFAKVMSDYSLIEAGAEMTTQLLSDGRKEMAALGLSMDELLYGQKGPESKSGLLGGLINDKVLNFDMLVELGLVNNEDRKSYIKDQTDRGVKYEDASANYISSTINNAIKSGAYTPESLAESVLDHTQLNINRMAEQTSRNKKEITDAARHWGNYPHRGIGWTPENAASKKKTDLFGEQDSETVVEDDRIDTDGKIETLRDLVVAGFGSSANGVSTSEADYDQGAQSIDAKNVTEVFEAIADLDAQAAFASVQNSPGHMDYLRGILNSIVAKVMAPVELFIDQHKIENETQGLYDVNGKRIWIQTQQLSTNPKPGMLSQGIRMAAAEVYAHELIHHITHTGLKKAPHLQRQAYALMELAFQEFTKKYGANAFRVFMNDPNADLNDPANAYEIIAAKDRWEYVFNQDSKADGRNYRLDEFIAFGMTNENFKRELATLSVSEEIIKSRKTLANIFEKNLQTTIVNLFTMVMDFLYSSFAGQVHSNQVDQELENLVRAISLTDSKTKSVLWSSLAKLEESATALSLQADEKIKEEVVKQFSKTKLSQMLTKLKELPELDNIISHQMRVILHRMNNNEYGLIPSIITEMRGTTERLRPLHDMLRMRKHVNDSAKNEAATVIQELVNSWFKRPLTSREKSAVTKSLLKTDVSSLLGTATPRAIIGYVADPRQREGRIQEILRQIENDPALKKFRHFFENAADDLGYFMITNDAQEDHSVPFMNAHNIVVMKDGRYPGELTGKDYTKAVSLVDQLVTLSSLRYVNNDHKAAAAQLMMEDWSAVEDVLNHHNTLKDAAFKDLFNSNPVLMTKGYVKQILNARIKYEQGTLADKQRYEDAGFYMQKTPISRDPRDPVRDDIYMFKSSLGTVNDLQSGIMSMTQNVGRGTVAYDIQMQLGTDPVLAAEISDTNNQIVLNHLLTKIDKMYDPRPARGQQRKQENYMLPKFSPNGSITQMRYMMSEHTKDTVLEQHSEFDAVLAAMTSQLVDKTTTPKINSDLVIALKELADAEMKKFPEAYVEISPWAKEQRHRDIYHQLPPKTKDQIYSIWGAHRMWVAQDVVDLAFGQRKYSVSETFGKTKKERNLFEQIMIDGLTFALGWNNPFVDSPADEEKNTSRQGNAVRRATRVYETMTQLTKLAKSNIVVRNLPVVFGNHQSNMMYLKSQGVPLEKILLLNKEASLGALAYQRDKYELESWKAKREVITRKHSMAQADKDIQLRNLDRKIVELRNRLANNPVTHLIDAGVMPGIVDDVETGHVQSPHIYGVDLALDKAINKLPIGLRKAGKTLFMTTDTEGFKMMNNAVKLTDFTGRYVLYHHLISQGMSHDMAVSEVMDKFINFDLPTHRMIGALNETGLLWFSKYQLRVLKHIKNVVLDRPFTTLATFILGSYIGNNNIVNSIPFITKEYSPLGIGDPLSAISTSPWDIVTVDGVQVAGDVLSKIVVPE